MNTEVATVGDLYAERCRCHGFSLDAALVRFAVNEEYRPADHPLRAGDEIVFIPPVNGG